MIYTQLYGSQTEKSKKEKRETIIQTFSEK